MISQVEVFSTASDVGKPLSDDELELLEITIKGDVAGHAFRGNQYTGGIGGIDHTETIQIPMGRSSKAMVEVPRYWYHALNAREIEKDGSIKGYDLPPHERELASNFKHASPDDKFVYIDPTPRNNSEIIDVKLIADRVRQTGQGQGFAIVHGGIPAEAIVGHHDASKKGDMGSDDFSIAGKLNPQQSESPPKKKRVRKVDDEGRYVTPFVSFADEGAGLAQLISSLNSNRLATWGFVAESKQVGRTRYQLTAVLDGRTSEFCKMINGRVFEIDDAQSKIEEALNVQDPEDLRQVQPWPDQSKDAIAEYEGMTDEELIAEGLHIPPFHPNCRTMCVVLRGDDVGEEPPSMEGGENVGDIPDTESTMQDFKGATPEGLTQDELDHWNEYVGLDPQAIMTAIFGDGGEIGFNANGMISFSKAGQLADGAYDIRSVFDPFSRTMYLSQADFELASADSAAGFMREVFSGMIDTGLSTGATALTVAVGHSAVEYVEMGFLPHIEDWQKIRLGAIDNIEKGKGEVSLAFGALDADKKDLLLNLLSNADEQSLQVISDTQWGKGNSILESILSGVSGDFSLDLLDPLQLQRAQEFFI